MTPAARIQAAIELLDLIIAAARDGGPAADTQIARYFKERRYAGSKDRRAVRDLVYAAIRRAADRPESGRSALVGLVSDRPELSELFDGSTHGPSSLKEGEAAATAGAVPGWLTPMLAAPVAPDEWPALLTRAPLDVRINRLKVEDAASTPLLEQLLADAQPVGGLPDAWRLPEGYPLEQGDAWKQGLVEVQDAGSQWISHACAARPQEVVIDLCAGAGGKTLALAAAMGGDATDTHASGRRLIAADTIFSRLARLAPRAERAGAAFIETLLLDQGHEHRALASLASQADLVLVDAPCSGTGTWRRNPEARWRLTPARLDRLIAEQARILDMAAQLVAPGGRLLYAVCSLLDREGGEQVRAFLRRNTGWAVTPLDLPVGRPHLGGTLLTPAHDGTDGFFFAQMRKA